MLVEVIGPVLARRVVERLPGAYMRIPKKYGPTMLSVFFHRPDIRALSIHKAAARLGCHAKYIGALRLAWKRYQECHAR